MIKDENMELAIKEARKAAQRDEIPVGAIIKETYGKIIARNVSKCGNRIRGNPNVFQNL